MRVIVFESPTNPVLKVADIAGITGLARRHGALTLLDNTLAGPHSHGEFDIDLYVHSLTKYVSGHGDVMGGAMIGRAELIQAMRSDLTVLGPTLDPHAAFPHAARPADLLRASRRAVPRRAAHRRVPPCAALGGTRVVSWASRTIRAMIGRRVRWRISAAS